MGRRHSKGKRTGFVHTLLTSCCIFPWRRWGRKTQRMETCVWRFAHFLFFNPSASDTLQYRLQWSIPVANKFFPRALSITGILTEKEEVGSSILGEHTMFSTVSHLGCLTELITLVCVTPQACTTSHLSPHGWKRWNQASSVWGKSVSTSNTYAPSFTESATECKTCQLCFKSLPITTQARYRPLIITPPLFVGFCLLGLNTHTLYAQFCVRMQRVVSTD